MTKFVGSLCALALAVLALSAAPSSTQTWAQTWPQRAVKFIVPFGPASGADITARLFGDRLSARWGKPVVVENRPGGDGLVAIGAFTAANEDHTFLFAPLGTFALHPYTQAKLPYDAERDIVPVASVTTIVLSISVPESLKIGSLGELAARARAEPGKLNVASATGLTDFLLGAFLKTADVQMTRVPYRDIVQAPNDLGEGRIQVLFSSLAAVQPQVQAGKVKLVAVTRRDRAPIVPDVPTVVEAGYPAIALDGLVGLYGPRGMPIELRERIAADFAAIAAAEPVIATRLAGTGQLVDIRGPAQFAAAIKEQRGQLAAIAQIIGVKPAQ